MIKECDKKGLSTIVATLIIILLVLVAVGIIWVVIRNVIQQGSEQVSLGKFTLDLQIEQVQTINDSNLNIRIKRNTGAGEFIALKFIIDDGQNREIVELNVSLNELDERTFSIYLLNVNASNLRKISIAPVFRLESGKRVTGDVKDEFQISSAGICSPICDGRQCGSDGCGGSCGICASGLSCQTNGTCTATLCTDTCSSLGYNCGTRTICGNSIDCGTCSSGFTCQTNGTCTVALCTDTCSSLGFNCGTRTICGASVNCGTCASGFTCQTNGTCIATPPTCTDTCSSLGYTCGTRTICGVSVNCGTCASGSSCQTNGTCIANPTCTDTCTSLGYTCGTRTICGVSVNCGTCGSGQTCSPSGTCVSSTCTSYTHFDGVCSSGCTGVDIDCHDSIAELNLPIPSPDDYSNKVYIDPTYNGAAGSGIGTLTRPYTSWLNVPSLNANTAYLQKRGTVNVITTSLSLDTSADNVLIGSYGDSGLPKPVINQTVRLGCNTFFFRFDGSYSTIRDIVLYTFGSNAAIMSRNTEDNVQFLTIYNVDMIGHSQYYRYETGLDIHLSKGVRILSSSTKNVGEDSFWLSDIEYAEIGYSSVEGTNLRYWDSSAADSICFWVAPGTDLGSINVQDGNAYSSGDGIQFENGNNVHIHHTYLNKDSPNKHAYINNNWNGINIFENNYVRTALGAAGSHIAGGHFIIRNNVWDYDLQGTTNLNPPGSADLGGFYGWASPLEIYNNIFMNHRYAIDLRGQSYDGYVFANNVFYNITGLQFNSWGDTDTDPVQIYLLNNIFLFRPEYSIMRSSPVYYDYNFYINGIGRKAGSDADGPHTLSGNPSFVNLQRTLSFCTGPGLSRCVLIPNFHLQSGSTAINAGTAAPYGGAIISGLPSGSGPYTLQTIPPGRAFTDLGGTAIPSSNVDMGVYQ